MGKPAKKTASKSRKTTRRKKKKGELGFSFWLALILFIILVIFIGHKPIKKFISETDFYKNFFNGRSNTELVVEKTEKKSNSQVAAPKTPEKETVIRLDDNKPAAETKVVRKTEKSESSSVKSVRDSVLYYVVLNDEGNIDLTKTTRKVYYSGSPLNASMNALLEGLTAGELNNGLMSLIPENTRILSITVDGGVANINFSEEFMFNSFGKEGTRIQLMQVVYTAVEFPTVRKVQFLVDNKKIDYICEGLYIGEPIGKDFFD